MLFRSVCIHPAWRNHGIRSVPLPWPSYYKDSFFLSRLNPSTRCQPDSLQEIHPYFQKFTRLPVASRYWFPQWAYTTLKLPVAPWVDMDTTLLQALEGCMPITFRPQRKCRVRDIPLVYLKKGKKKTFFVAMKATTSSLTNKWSAQPLNLSKHYFRHSLHPLPPSHLHLTISVSS